MKILMFDYEYPPLGGGGGVVNAHVARELARRHEVWVITSRFRGLPAREEVEGVSVVRVPVWGRSERSVASLRSMLTYPPGAWVAGTRLLRRKRFDVVNGHFAVPTGPGSLPAARLAGVPHIITLHGGDIYNPAYWLSPHRVPGVRATVGWILRHSDVVVADSRDTRERVYRYHSYRGPVEIIPHGIPLPQIERTSRAELGLPEAAFVAVTVGRLLHRKAVDRLLKALARPECAEIHLVVVGPGPERSGLESLARTLGLDSRVRFEGRVEESRKWQILAAADIYVSASLHEGFGLVFLEAMAAGLPVVCTTSGGQMDFLADGETGYLVAPGDENGLAAAIVRLRERPADARRIGEHNLHEVQRFSVERCAAAYEDVFERTVRSRAARRG